MNLVLFILGVIGLSHIIVDSEVMGPVQAWLKPRCPALAYIMGCYQCAGYWCGLVFGFALLSYHPAVILAAGFAGSFLAQLGYWTLNVLEHYGKEE